MRSNTRHNNVKFSHAHVHVYIYIYIVYNKKSLFCCCFFFFLAHLVSNILLSLLLLFLPFRRRQLFSVRLLPQHDVFFNTQCVPQTGHCFSLLHNPALASLPNVFRVHINTTNVLYDLNDAQVIFFLRYCLISF